MELYSTPDSCSLASHMAFAETDTPYEVVRLSFQTADQLKPDYLAINPKGRVPALVTDRGVLTETPAILAFIVQVAPVDDPFAFAQVQAFNVYLCSTVHVAHAQLMRGHRWADDPAAIEALRRKVPDTVRDAFAPIEHGMLAGPWVMGDRYTICDTYLFTLAQWLEADGVNTAGFGNILDHWRRMLDRPAVVTALAQA